MHIAKKHLMILIMMYNKYLIFIPVFLFVFFIDQYSKWWIMHRFFDQDVFVTFSDWFLMAPEILAPFEINSVAKHLNIVSVWNKGISFGFLSDRHGDGVTSHILVILSFIIMGFFIRLFHMSRKPVQHFGASLIIGGALGNIADRIRFTAVYDFLDFHYDGWHYPAFNIADTAITVGVIMYIVGAFFEDNRRKFARKATEWHAK